MDHQLSFADSKPNNKRRHTRKEKFLSRTAKLIPWLRFESVIEPHYPKAGNGRKPYSLPTMLRIHCMQEWYSLSGSGMEGAISDHTTIMNFRYRLELHGFARQIFNEVSTRLVERYCGRR